MRRVTIEIIPDPEEGGFTACVPNIPAYGEGETEDEAISDLREALKAYIDAIGIDQTLAQINPPRLREVELDFVELARG